MRKKATYRMGKRTEQTPAKKASGMRFTREEIEEAMSVRQVDGQPGLYERVEDSTERQFESLAERLKHTLPEFRFRNS